MKDLREMDTEEFIIECRKAQKRAAKTLKEVEAFEAKLEKIDAENVNEWIRHTHRRRQT